MKIKNVTSKSIASLLFVAILFFQFSCKKEDDTGLSSACSPDAIICPSHFVDERDGQEYPVVKIGCNCWMAKNLNYAEFGVCYDSLESNCEKYGRLYTIAEVMQDGLPTDSVPSGVQGICPKGWHVPSGWEWRNMIDTLGGLEVAGGRMRADTTWLYDENNETPSGFEALAGGQWTGRQFSSEGILAVFWSTSGNSQNDAHLIIRLRAYTSDADVSGLRSNRKASCRCLKD